MKKFIISIILCTITLMAQPNDEYWEHGPLIQSLESFVTNEHLMLKQSIDSITDLNFQWCFCSFAAFPIIKGQRCPYFSDIEHYRDIGSYKSSVYIHNDRELLVGTRFWYQGEDVPDTVYYKIVAYKFTKNKNYYLWRRAYSYATYTVVHGVLTDSVGRE